MRLEVLPVEKIIPDPDTQFEWTFNPRWIKKRMAEGGYDPDKAGVINVSRLNGANEGFYGAWWGRHRVELARASNVRTVRADVDEGKTVEEKLAIKLSKDRDQRRVPAIEIFLNERDAGDPVAI